MPELPEAELAASQLRAWVDRIDTALVNDERALRGQDTTAFCRALEGRTIEKVERLGKHIVADLGGGRAWWIHLGMSGRLARREADDLPAATRWAVRSQSRWVGLVDPRIFGRTAAGERSWVLATAKLDDLGPDALVIRKKALATALGGTRRAVKTALMDQSLVAGLGNIQVAEALFRARLHPARRSDTLDEAEVAALWRGMRGTLRDTLRDLRDQVSRAESSGEVIYMSDGASENPFQVYGREGEPCVRCGAPLERIVQGGRSSFFCPDCQPPR
ncbi:MAG: formamidopyrimidine-DNA glycosylase [Sandaracinus sp.]|nr:formamidopyrimidine-DNA glycosylase [Sandaracinus sp.]